MYVAARMATDDDIVREWPLNKLARWVAFFSSEWDPEQHEERRAGTISAVVANVMTKGGFEPENFMRQPAVTAEADPDEAERAAERWVVEAGGIVRKANGV